MEILRATAEHVHEIARLAGIVWRAHYPAIISPEQIEYMLAKMYDLGELRREMATGVTYLRAIEAEELLGFAAFGPIANQVKLHKLYVHPKHQRRGIGTALIQHIERAAVGRTLVLTVNKRNHKAIAAYKKHGFGIRDSIVVEIGSGFVMDDYVMEKNS